MPITDDAKYEELSRAWLHFASWRERILAGYLTVLATLAYAFSKEPSSSIRAALFGFAILVSFVFRILDIRTTKLVNVCQVEGARLAGSKGLYAAIHRDRFGSPDAARTQQREKWFRVTSYGFAINVLVATVSGLSATGLFIYMLKWSRGAYTVRWYWAFNAVLLAVAFFLVFEHWTSKIFGAEKVAHFSSIAHQAEASSEPK